MRYQVQLHRVVARTLSRMNPQERSRIVRALHVLETDPYEPRTGADIVRLKGTKGREDLFRLRVGNYRAVYAIQGRTVYVTDLFRRGRGYAQSP
ncbi:MAG: type II toxin-antitoxin system RelE/ParE family toxin [archaeon]